MPPKLKIDPCPMCGQVVDVKDAAPHPSGQAFYISCPVYGSQTHHIIARGKTVLEVVKLWNWKHKAKD